MNILDPDEQIDFKSTIRDCVLACPICSDIVNNNTMNTSFFIKCECSKFYGRLNSDKNNGLVLYFNPITIKNDDCILFSGKGITLRHSKKNQIISNKTSFSLNEMKNLYEKYLVLI